MYKSRMVHTEQITPCERALRCVVKVSIKGPSKTGLLHFKVQLVLFIWRQSQAFGELNSFLKLKKIIYKKKQEEILS